MGWRNLAVKSALMMKALDPSRSQLSDLVSMILSTTTQQALNCRKIRFAVSGALILMPHLERVIRQQHGDAANKLLMAIHWWISFCGTPWHAGSPHGMQVMGLRIGANAHCRGTFD